jgi:amidophosphoribosyltransferase
MCGIFGAFQGDQQLVFQDLLKGLTLLQHRGQDSAGIVLSNGNKYYAEKVSDMLSQVDNSFVKMGIAHVRYKTSDGFRSQPLVNDRISLAHNGNVDKSKLQDYLGQNLELESDSEGMLKVLVKSLNGNIDKDSIVNALMTLAYVCKGSYSIILLIKDFGLVLFRDPRGIRPLVYGNKDSMFFAASEDCALDLDSRADITDVNPGEAIFVTENGIDKKIILKSSEYTPCLFEYIYMSRADSFINGISVYDSRVMMGKLLAKQIKKWNLPIDVVVGVPDTGRISAIEVASELGITYKEGFIRNSNVSRTFILDSQKKRNIANKNKFGIIKSVFDGKNVLIIDDSVVRGNTSRNIVTLIRNAGAKKVFLGSCAPAVLSPNTFGIDIKDKSDLVATKGEVYTQNYIGIDKIFYQDLESLTEGLMTLNSNLSGFEVSMFISKS